MLPRNDRSNLLRTVALLAASWAAVAAPGLWGAGGGDADSPFNLPANAGPTGSQGGKGPGGPLLLTIPVVVSNLDAAMVAPLAPAGAALRLPSAVLLPAGIAGQEADGASAPVVSVKALAGKPIALGAEGDTVVLQGCFTMQGAGEAWLSAGLVATSQFVVAAFGTADGAGDMATIEGAVSFAVSSAGIDVSELATLAAGHPDLAGKAVRLVLVGGGAPVPFVAGEARFVVGEGAAIHVRIPVAPN